MLLENDILETLSNLSNSEVFTPPRVAEQMVDLIPEIEFSNPNNKFLDPFSKTGVFLKILLIKLLRGLPFEKNFKSNNWIINNKGEEEQVIVDLTNEQVRYDYILKHMLYGIAITEITDITTRRTLYDVMEANSNRSDSNLQDENISNFNHKLFKNKYGNIYWNDVDENGNETPPKHKFVKNKKDMVCEVCGMRKGVEKDIENFAYPFIHKTDEELNKIFKNNFNLIKGKNMKFDVIIGNPPYHLSDGGGGTGKPIYQNFINKSISVSPKYLIMIVPSRWMAGGEVVLDKFREQMLNDKRLRSIYDFKDAQVCFPSVGFGGGVNYFLWDRDYNGSCEYTFKDENGESKTNLNLSKYKILVRKIDSLDLLNKILNKDSNFFGRKTIGSLKTFVDEKVSKTHFRSNFKDFKIEKDDINNIELYGKKADGARNDKMVGYVNKSQITKNIEEIGKYKVLTQKTSDDVNVLSEPFLAEPNSVWTETNFQIGWGMNYNKEECLNLIKYMKTKFVRFLISLAKISHNMSFKVFLFVPILDMKIEWTAKMLYERYDLTDSEIKHIESSIKEMV